MTISSFLDVLKKMFGDLSNGWEHESFEDGIIVITSLGDYYVDVVNGKLEHQRLEYILELREGVRPMELDLRGLPYDLRFPLRIKYSTLGFFGPLSGSSGYLFIFRNGGFLFWTLLLS